MSFGSTAGSESPPYPISYKLMRKGHPLPYPSRTGSRKVVLPLGVEPKSPASEASILSIEIQEREVPKSPFTQVSQPFPNRRRYQPYLAGSTRSAKSA